MPKGILVQYQKAGVIIAGVVLTLSLTSCKSEEIVITPTPLPTVSQEVITPTEAPVVPTKPVEESPEPSPSDIIIIDGPDETPTPTKKPNEEKSEEIKNPSNKPAESSKPAESKNPVQTTPPEETVPPVVDESLKYQEEAAALIKKIRSNIESIQANRDSLSETIKGLRDTLKNANEAMKEAEATLKSAQTESEKYKALAKKMADYQQKVSELNAKLATMKADAVKLGNQIDKSVEDNIQLNSILSNFNDRVNVAEKNIGEIHTSSDLKALEALLAETNTWLTLSGNMNTSIDKTAQTSLNSNLTVTEQANSIKNNITEANTSYQKEQSSSSSSSGGGNQTPPPPIEDTTKDPNDNIDAGGFEKPATDGDSKENPEDDGPRVQL